MVTGTGATLTNTTTVEQVWDNICAGHAQVGRLTRFDRAEHGLPLHAPAQNSWYAHRTFQIDVLTN
ncbi:hypothetical protein VM98_37195, partial [Streptomyces rubellomurinus subsp. indigoferus]